MATKKSMWVLFGILVISAWVLGSAIQAGAETLTFRSFSQVAKEDMVPIGDVEGHAVGVSVRDGTAIFGNGEWAWVKSTYLRDVVKGAGTSDSYTVYTFQDKSTIVVRRKGTLGATPAGFTSGAEFGGDIINGTGRFQGIKGTMKLSSTILPPEPGELGGKAHAEGTLIYTLPGK